MPYTQITYQIVFSTKGRIPAMQQEKQPILYQYLFGILKEKGCHVYRINGIEDHIHILIDLAPKIALSELVKDLKLASSSMIKRENLFTNWPGWQSGYGAFTYSADARPRLIEYVKNQKEHHKKVSPRDEYINLSKEHEIYFEEKYVE